MKQIQFIFLLNSLMTVLMASSSKAATTPTVTVIKTVPTTIISTVLTTITKTVPSTIVSTLPASTITKNIPTTMVSTVVTTVSLSCSSSTTATTSTSTVQPPSTTTSSSTTCSSTSTVTPSTTITTTTTSSSSAVTSSCTASAVGRSRNILFDIITPTQVLGMESSRNPSSNEYGGIDERLELDSSIVDKAALDAWNDIAKYQAKQLSPEKLKNLQSSFNAINSIFEAQRINIAKNVILSAPTANPVCPTAIAPCACSAVSNGVGLNCNSQGLIDSKLSNILDAFLVPGISPLVSLSASTNNLTIVPTQIPKFTSLWYIDLSSNKITALPSGAFSYPSATFLYVYLYLNQITSIPSDAFNCPNASNINVLLYSNQITAIPSGMFNYPSAYSISIFLSSNLISSIPTGMFNYPAAKYVFVSLYGNQIAAIPPGMFSYPSATDVAILLVSNQITSISSSMFNFPSATGSINIWLHSNQLTAIPQGMLNYPSATSIQMLFSGNQITSIPSGMFNYPKATSMALWLDSNKIPSIPAGTMNFPMAINVQATLSYNSITTVGTSTFQAGNFSIFFISNNQLAPFPSNVFKSILKTVPTASSFWLKSNPIDCSGCNLAWLIRDNRQLLNPINGGTCSNGTTFANLNPNGFANCPVDC